MATDHDSLDGNAPNTVDNDSLDTQKKLTHGRWTITVRNYVSSDLFRYVQFVNCDRDIEFGSGIQKIVCKQCSIPPGDQLEYWSNYGSDEVLEVLRRKRQAIATSFKTRFGSKYK
jgi:hypothetical protein